MSVETLQYIEIAAYIVAGLFLITAIILYFVLKIPAVIGDLTGSTARKAIESIRQQNENAANDKGRKPAAPTYNEKKKTSTTSRLKKTPGAVPGETTKMATAQLQKQAQEATEAANATTVLTPEQLPGGAVDPNATTILTPDQLPGGAVDPGATTVLTPDQLPYADNPSTNNEQNRQIPTPVVQSSIDIEMGFAESSETIE